MAHSLHEIVAKGLIIEPSMVTDALEYNSIREWDSVAHMALIAELEDAYDIMLDTDDIIDMSSVGKIREILKKYDVEA
jgi:acyl carrier protein